MTLKARLHSVWGCAVAFRIYDLDNTGHIERGEIQRFLVALLKDNPAIDLDDAHLNSLIDRVSMHWGQDHLLIPCAMKYVKLRIV